MTFQFEAQNIGFITPFRTCYGSDILCEVAIDPNNTLLDSQLKNLTWPPSYNAIWGWTTTTTKFKRIETLVKSIIVIKLKYKSPEIETTVLNARTTLTDKIANFGGTFGIWAELTGCSLLGFINMLMILMKFMFRTRD